MDEPKPKPKTKERILAEILYQARLRETKKEDRQDRNDGETEEPEPSNKFDTSRCRYSV